VGARVRPLDPFLSYRQSWALSYSRFNAAIKSVAASLRLIPKRYSTHSLRIGGASVLAAAGLQDYFIVSDLYQVRFNYVRQGFVCSYESLSFNGPSFIAHESGVDSSAAVVFRSIFYCLGVLFLLQPRPRFLCGWRSRRSWFEDLLLRERLSQCFVV
jgi:hypothetical protein